MKGKVKCPNCGWSWNKSESSEKDMHVCHNCGKSDVNMKNGGWLDNIPQAQEGEVLYTPPKSQYKRLYGHGSEYGVGENKNMRIDPDTGYSYFPPELSINQKKEVPDSPWNISRFLFDPFIKNVSQGLHNAKYTNEGEYIDSPGDVMEQGHLANNLNRRERYNAAKKDITNYYKEDLKLNDDEVEKKVDDTMDLIRKMRRTDEMMQRHNASYTHFQNPEEVFKRAVGFYGDDNQINPSEAKRAYKMFQKTWRGTSGKEARQNSREELRKAEEAFKLAKKQKEEGLLKPIKPDPNYVPEDFANGGILKNGGWLDQYADGGTMQEHQENYNNNSVSLPEGFVGMGNNTKGRNYSPAWGGQFQEGGEIPKAQKGIKKPLYVESENDPRYKAYNDSLSLYNNSIKLKKNMKNYLFETDKSLIGDKRTLLNKALKIGFKDKKELDKYLKSTLLDFQPKWKDFEKFKKEYDLKQVRDNLYSIKDSNVLVDYPDDRTQLIHKIIKPKSILTGISDDTVYLDKNNTNPYQPIKDYRRANQILKDQGIQFKNQKEYENWKKYESGVGNLYKLNPFMDDQETIWHDTYEFFDYSNVNPKQQVIVKPTTTITTTKKPKPDKTKEDKKRDKLIPIQNNLQPEDVKSDFSIDAQLPMIRPEARMPKSYDVNSQRQTMSGPSEYYNYSDEGVDFSDALRAKESADAYNQYIQEKYKEAAKTNPKAQKRLEQLMQNIELTPNYQMGGDVYPVNYVPQAQDGEKTYSYPLRDKLYPGEEEYFKANPHVGGMAAEDNQVIINPYSSLSDEEKNAIRMNETARLAMRNGYARPTFDLTPEQKEAFKNYSTNEQDQRETIIGRILSGDPSAKNVTPEQKKYAEELQKVLKFQGGGSIPGAVGFTYARTKGIPSNGPYAKKTMASAQNGVDIYDNPLIARIVNNANVNRSYYDPRLNTMNMGSDYNMWHDQETGEPLTGDDLKYQQDKMLAHENYHAMQHKEGRDNYDIAHSTDNEQWARMQKRPELMSTNAVWNNFYNRSAIENIQDYANKINEVPEARLINQNLLFDKVLDRERYDNPSNLEGEAKFYEDTGVKFQNGGEMRYYQHGLDFKTKGMKDGGWLDGYKEGGIIKDDRGQWDHPGEITEIGSNQITMQGVPYDVLGISDEGDTKLMKPGKNYKFKGKKVTEFPMAKDGIRQEQKGLVNLDNLLNFTNYNKPQPGGWLSKYE